MILASTVINIKQASYSSILDIFAEQKGLMNELSDDDCHLSQVFKKIWQCHYIYIHKELNRLLMKSGHLILFIMPIKLKHKKMQCVNRKNKKWTNSSLKMLLLFSNLDYFKTNRSFYKVQLSLLIPGTPNSRNS